MTQKKMGKMTSLSKLSGIKKQPEETTVTPESPPEPLVEEVEVKEPETPETKVKEVQVKGTKAKVEKQNLTKEKQEKPIKVNINIRKDQKDWLTDTASQVRENNILPVPPAERVYPQHLIGVAIDLLQAKGVDWSEVRNVEELREQLNL